MAKVTGIGGVFIRARDPQALGAWYRRHLGVGYENGFATFAWRDDPDAEAQSVWCAFDRDSDDFGPRTQQVTINYRVDELEPLLAALEGAGVAVAPERTDDENGRFAWIVDPEGNRIELWEPVRTAR